MPGGRPIEPASTGRCQIKMAKPNDWRDARRSEPGCFSLHGNIAMASEGLDTRRDSTYLRGSNIDIV
jgi:hypothetical protein